MTGLQIIGLTCGPIKTFLRMYRIKINQQVLLDHSLARQQHSCKLSIRTAIAPFLELPVGPK